MINMDLQHHSNQSPPPQPRNPHNHQLNHPYQSHSRYPSQAAKHQSHPPSPTQKLDYGIPSAQPASILISLKSSGFEESMHDLLHSDAEIALIPVFFVMVGCVVRVHGPNPFIVHPGIIQHGGYGVGVDVEEDVALDIFQQARVFEV